jgi:NADPH:quinone reductase-like Zn-dependent oxidoreductase
VTCGATSGPVVETDLRIVFWKHLRIIGSTMANRTEFRHVMGQLIAGRLTAIVDHVVPLAEVAQALARLQKAEQFGKVVVRL